MIKVLNTDALFSNPLLKKTLHRLRFVLQDFSSYLLFHILPGLNKEADAKENLGFLLPQGALRKNEEEPKWETIP